MDSKRCIIINADDFGYSAKVNEAICLTANTGVVTSTTVMVNSLTPEGEEQLRDVSKRIGVGLHVNITEGKPLSPQHSVASLTDSNGRFLPPRELALHLLKGQVRQKELELEITAQLHCIQTIMPTITHVDSHQHMHIYPQVAEAMLNIAKSAGIHRIRTTQIQRTFSQSLGHLLRHPTGVIGLLLKIRQRQLFDKYGFVSPDYLLYGSGLGIIPTLIPERARLLARSIPVGISELNCHPGNSMHDELFLSSPFLRRSLDEEHVQLVDFSAIQF